jgi:hypothetical protein
MSSWAISQMRLYDELAAADRHSPRSVCNLEALATLLGGVPPIVVIFHGLPVVKFSHSDRPSVARNLRFLPENVGV